MPTFDFMLQKYSSNMIVSQRLDLINKVYGKIHILKKTYYCGTKIYLKLADFHKYRR